MRPVFRSLLVLGLAAALAACGGPGGDDGGSGGGEATGGAGGRGGAGGAGGGSGGAGGTGGSGGSGGVGGSGGSGGAGGSGGSAGSGGSGGGGGGGSGGGAASGPTRYPFGRAHSPLTDSVAANLRAIVQKSTANAPDVFAKVGDSNTVNTNFVACFAGANVDLAGRPLQQTLNFFKAGVAGTTTPYDRVSLAAAVGWRAAGAISGNPSPLEQECDAIHPRYAAVMFGTNDVQVNDPAGYGVNLFTIVDTLVARGTVPILTSVPPRDDSAAADAQVPRFNAIAQGVAQARQVPFADLHQALLPIPAHGLAGDGVHLNVYAPSGARGCVLNATGLGYGHNNRNLLTLQALDRARAAVDGAPAPDTAPAALAGSGTLADPFVIPSLPFVDLRDTRVGATNRVSTWSGCSTANEGGPELLYRLDLAQPTNLRAIVVSLGGADIDVHVVDSTGAAAGCVARNDKVVTASLGAGRWYLALDTYVSAGTALSGEYLVAVLAD